MHAHAERGNDQSQLPHWPGTMPLPRRRLHVHLIDRLAPPPYPPPRLGPGRADDPVEYLGALGGPGGQHGHRPPAPRPPTGRRGCRCQPVYLPRLGHGFPAHGFNRLRRTSRWAQRWGGVAADPVARLVAGAGPGNAAGHRGYSPEPPGPGMDAALARTEPTDPRVFPHPPVRPARRPGQLCPGRLVPRHPERPSAIGDFADHQLGQHRAQPMVRPRPGLGCGRLRPRLGNRRVDRRPARPGAHAKSPACLSWAYRLGRLETVAKLAPVAGGQPRHFYPQPGVAVGVFHDHGARRKAGRCHSCSQCLAAQWAVTDGTCPGWPGSRGRGSVRPRHRRL